MNNEVAATSKKNAEKQNSSAEANADELTPEQASEQITELSEDMEMVSPGAMLLEARKALSLSQEHIANKLNFKMSLVKDIENDSFDPGLPATFNRGYLANYAKLVGIDVVDVLASYDALDAATIQRSEMLSFSKETTKQAEHSRVMWLSYLIVAVFIGLTIIWWLQESKQQGQDTFLVTPKNEVVSAEEKQNTSETNDSDKAVALTAEKSPVNGDVDTSTAEKILKEASTSEQVSNDTDELASSPDTILSESLQAPLPAISTAVFTFKGDCWVNIFDATGERVAWGVKKAGYVMSIQGIAPLKITVGKPELTSITFNDESVDMSRFNTGNIAKFNLPLGEYAN